MASESATSSTPTSSAGSIGGESSGCTGSPVFRGRGAVPPPQGDLAGAERSATTAGVGQGPHRSEEPGGAGRGRRSRPGPQSALPDCLGLDLDGDLLADEDTAGLESLVPGEAEGLPVEF